jgi:hypothetical protein
MIDPRPVRASGVALPILFLELLEYETGRFAIHHSTSMHPVCEFASCPLENNRGMNMQPRQRDADPSTVVARPCEILPGVRIVYA